MSSLRETAVPSFRILLFGVGWTVLLKNNKNKANNKQKYKPTRNLKMQLVTFSVSTVCLIMVGCLFDVKISSKMVTRGPQIEP